MLWVLLCASLFRVFNTIELPLFLLNLTFSTFILHTCMKRVENGVVFVLLVLSVPGWLTWCNVTLMESGLWCLLLTLLVLATIEQRARTVLFIIPFVVLCRPESMLWCGCCILLLGFFTAATKGWKQGVIASMGPAVAFMVALAGLIAFRLYYFGWPVPNTYYAKVSPNFLSNIWRGCYYLYKYISGNPAVLLAVGILAWVLIRAIRCRAWRSKSFFLGLCLLPGITIPIIVGGDHFVAFRFYQPIWPLLCLLAEWEWSVLFGKIHPQRQRVFLVCLVACGWLLFPFTTNLCHEFQITHEGRATGAALEKIFADCGKLPSVASIPAGGIKYAYSGHVYDVLGLNNVEMAHTPGERNDIKNHAAFNSKIFYRWHPDLLLYTDSHEFDLMVLKGLHDELQFNAHYRKAVVSRNGKSVSAYFSRDFLQQLDGSFTIQ